LGLETALIQVKQLEFEERQYAEVVALRQAAAQCRRTIDGFLKKIEKYQPSLSGNSEGHRVRDAWMKVKWALCKKEDVAKFKADLVGHTESIQLLLMTVQMYLFDLLQNASSTVADNLEQGENRDPSSESGCEISKPSSIYARWIFWLHAAFDFACRSRGTES
jgi:hypothetical protein